MFGYFSLVLFIIYLIYIKVITMLVVNKNNTVIYRENTNLSNVGLIVIFCVLEIMSTTRNINIGTDTGMYHAFYLGGGYDSVLEIGFIKIYDLAKLLGSFDYWLFITSFTTLFFIFLGIKKNTSDYLLGALFFVITYSYFFTYNGVRQALAVSIVFGFFHLLINKNIRKVLLFIAIVLISMLFHNSAITLLILLFIPTKKVINATLVGVAFIITTFMYFSIGLKNEIGILISKNSFFYSEKYTSNISFFFEVNKDKGLLEFIPVSFQMIIIMIVIIVIKKNEIKDPFLNLTTNIYVFYLCVYSLAGIEAADRFQNYLQFFNVYFLTSISVYFLKNSKKGYLFVVIIIAFFFAYFVLRILRNTSGVLGI